MAESKAKTNVPTFKKSQLMASKRYQNKVDLVDALLSDDKEYTLDEVDKIIDNFLKGKVN